ncbi:acetyltransferase (GNAT) family protein [Bacillus oleivorans]|uniref:Acetyltransferase (GNAT) family protein n=1 Tax=Bacillus oleivorans TaxID=1448271 RepID=A0A285CMA6_9BACI|nr:GNAT family N-acetyltransferase [Bacillus oleivorans]SNX68679.1 acetyltransferase (GNAT) family protein [Bacillus oleivorans]
MLEIREIQAEDTYGIRHQVLRPNQTIEDCKYDGDFDLDTFHVGAFLDEELVSIASFYRESSPGFPEVLQYRLRGMATLEHVRNQKAGSSILHFAERILEKREASLWWCNARVSVSDYYKKLGLHEYGEVFEIEPIGPHKLMYKKLYRL